MDRRKFLSWIPKIVGGAAVAPHLNVQDPKVVGDEPTTRTEFRTLDEEEQIAIADAAAICFGLRPKGLETPITESEEAIAEGYRYHLKRMERLNKSYA